MAPKRTILLLEDDPNLGFVLQEHLEANGFAVELRTNGEEGLTAAGKRTFSLMLVDIMMPRKDGFTFAREIRRNDTTTPIIFLTAKSLKEDRIEGFRIGGDDYVTKPFSSEELLLRIQAVLKRTEHSTTPIAMRSISFGSFILDASGQCLVRGRKKIPLTTREAELLHLLASRLNILVDRSEILRTLWGDDSYFNGRSLDVFVSRLRKHLAADKQVELKNIHGKGYRLLLH